MNAYSRPSPHEADTTRAGLVTLAAVVLWIGIGGALLVARAAARVVEPDRAAPESATDVGTASFEHARGWLRAEDEHARVQERADSLGEYGWIDRDAGLVRVPAERAMQLLLEERARGSTSPGGPR